MIQVQNLTKYYGDFLALDDLTFTIETGRILGFLGPNGAGKSTTMKILSCFMAPSAGNVLINGMNVTTDGMRIKKITGYLPENPPLYFDMTVDEYLTYVAELKGVQPDMIPARLRYVKEQCGLMDRSKKLISTLSKGYKQRVGIAQSLVNDPEVLILDEPTIGLDPKQISDIRTLIRSQAGTRTIILSTHILSEVTLICDDILIINKGKIYLNDALANVGGRDDLEQVFMKYTYNFEAPVMAE